MRWLVSDFDYRDPHDELHDIETGKYLGCMSSLGGSIRQMLQEGDVFVEYREVGEGDKARYEIVRIVKKREPEYNQGQDHYFVADRFGRQVRLTEDEYDKLLNLSHNPEDVYEQEELDLQSLEHYQSPAKDVWDVLYDATEFLNTAERLLKDESWQQKPYDTKIDELHRLADGKHPEHPDIKVYSAEWFPYPADHRVKTARVKQIVDKIDTGNLSRSEVSKLINAFRPPRDLRPQKAEELKVKAATLPPGKERAMLMMRAQAMLDGAARTRKAVEKKGLRELEPSERAQIWEAWRERQLKLHGKVELTDWQFKRMYLAKLMRQGIPHIQAQKLASERTLKLYGKDCSVKIDKLAVTQIERGACPEWLAQQELTFGQVQEDTEFVCADWLPTATVQALEETLDSACQEE